MASGIKLTTEEFIEKSKSLHGDTYDYEKASYINSLTKIILICKQHNIEFSIHPKYHLGKDRQGCPECGNIAKKNKLRDTLEDFLQKVKAVHGDTYTYDYTQYVTNKDDVEIGCRIHGSFWQSPDAHINQQQGCPKCGSQRSIQKRTKKTEQFIIEAKLAHGEIYDYSRVMYKNAHAKVEIGHPQGGYFWQVPQDHLYGYHPHTPPSTSNVLNNKQLLSNLLCNGIDKAVTELQVDRSTVNRHARSHQIAAEYPSLLEKTFGEWLHTLPFMFNKDRKILEGKEIDFLCAEQSLGIEISGLFWHSEAGGKDKRYHYAKYINCVNRGVQLITIFEDEWQKKRNIIENIIMYSLGLLGKGRGARHHTIKTIDCKTASIFFERYHIQGSSRFTDCLGAYLDDQLVAVMGFGHPSRSGSSYDVELKRFCSDNMVYPGIGSKLFAKYIEWFKPTNVVTFSDNRYFLGKIYKSMGFYFDKEIAPDYQYTDNQERYNKSRFRSTATENEKDIVAKLGLSRIWDCGKKRFVWRS